MAELKAFLDACRGAVTVGGERGAFSWASVKIGAPRHRPGKTAKMKPALGRGFLARIAENGEVLAL